MSSFPPSSFRLPPLKPLPFPGVFGVFYESDRPTKNALEKKWIDTTREKLGNRLISPVTPEDFRQDEMIG
jgi:hypothetical protein